MIVFLRLRKVLSGCFLQKRKSGAFSDEDLKKRRKNVDLSFTAKTRGKYCEDSFGKCPEPENCIIRTASLICLC